MIYHERIMKAKLYKTDVLEKQRIYLKKEYILLISKHPSFVV